MVWIRPCTPSYSYVFSRSLFAYPTANLFQLITSCIITLPTSSFFRWRHSCSGYYRLIANKILHGFMSRGHRDFYINVTSYPYVLVEALRRPPCIEDLGRFTSIVGFPDTWTLQTTVDSVVAHAQVRSSN